MRRASAEVGFSLSFLQLSFFATPEFELAHLELTRSFSLELSTVSFNLASLNTVASDLRVIPDALTASPFRAHSLDSPLIAFDSL